MAVVLLVVLLSLNPLPWNTPVDRLELDILFKLRGPRQVTDDVVLIYIGAEDIAALDGWPLGRDYYSYMTHILHQAGAGVIGYDIFFDTPEKYYDEYDQTFGEFIAAAGNVCLPMVFASIEKTRGVPDGLDPRLPIRGLADNAAGIGFSNINPAASIRKTPLLLKNADSLYTLFGLEMARVYLNGTSDRLVPDRNGVKLFCRDRMLHIPADDQTGYLINHFGGLEKISALSFVDVLKMAQEAADPLDFREKLVFVAVTAPGYASLRSTPYSDTFPAGLVHLTVAENIITHNMLFGVPFYFRWLIFAALAFFPVAVRHNKRMVLLDLLCLTVYVLAAVILFHQNRVLPLVFPALALLGTTVYFVLQIHFRKKSGRYLLEQELDRKQQDLDRARRHMSALQSKLAAEQKEKQSLSRQSRQTLEEKLSLIRELEKKIRDLESYVLPDDHQIERKIHAPEIICADNSRLNNTLELAAKAGTDTIPVVLFGETGTGKEIVSRYIHRCSRRKDGPFVAFNCGALADTLLESELFGHEKGSFTGAYSTRKGRFELADGGTIFLDEITETSPAFQTKLLRVLQEGAFERIGGEKPLRVDVRVIVAANRDLKKAVETGAFREDLYYRLNAFPIQLPPLRERRCDIPLLAGHFLTKYGHADLSLSGRVMEILDAYRWPGNVRELENCIRRAAILAKSDGRTLIQTYDLPVQVRKGGPSPNQVEVLSFGDQVLELLRNFHFSHNAISRTAKSLDRDRGTITEYFRGICFEYLCNHGFGVEQAARSLADAENKTVVTRVRRKIKAYLRNLDYSVPLDGFPEIKDHPSFKGLPQKYHDCLHRVYLHFQDSTDVA